MFSMGTKPRGDLNGRGMLPPKKQHVVKSPEGICSLATSYLVGLNLSPKHATHMLVGRGAGAAR